MQGFPPRFPPVAKGMERETMEQPTTVDSHVEGVLVDEPKEEVSSFENPSTPAIVQQISTKDMAFGFQMEGQPSAHDWVFTHPSDDTVAT